MASLPTIQLGAPGIYPYPEVPLRALTGVRMDVCAFVGVAPRGPARAPLFDEHWRDGVPCVEPERPRRRTVAMGVQSFDEYRQFYGGFEGPGLLPYAVAAFFDQGGRRAYIARIVHEYQDPAKNAGRTATGAVPDLAMEVGTLGLRARNEGSWGNGLRAAMTFSSGPVHFESSSTTGLTLPADSDLPGGALLRLTLPGGLNVLRYVTAFVEQGRRDGSGYVLLAIFDQPTVVPAESASSVEGTLSIEDGDTGFERHERLGLASGHPRWMATVLCYESRLVYPDPSWIDDRLDYNSLIPGTLTPRTIVPPADPAPPQFGGGEDRFDDIIPDDFFDPIWTPADDEPGSGVQSLVHLADLSTVVVPDLYSPAPLSEREFIVDGVSLAGATFERCLEVQTPPVPQENPHFDLAGLRLDPRLQSDLDLISFWQQQLVAFADLLGSFVVLLDVPPGLSQRQIMRWRAPFGSSYTAAYHPWLKVSRPDDERDDLIQVPPSAVAAGIIAQREIAFGVPHGPANVIAAGIVDVLDHVSPARHDELHPLGINVYLRERDGIRLTAARTLSRDKDYRQLSVRRLLIMLRRVLEQKTQWIVFEPNNSALRREVCQLLRGYLLQLYRQGAFRGATDKEAFFVRCDETLNTRQIVDAGQLIAQIGVAPAEPLEFIVLRLSRDGDNTLTVQE